MASFVVGTTFILSFFFGEFNGKGQCCSKLANLNGIGLIEVVDNAHLSINC